MSWYIVDIRCPKCGKVHRASSQRRIPDGPDQPGSIADLYGTGKLPPMLASMLNDLVWCEVTEQWVNQTERTRVYLTPRRSSI
jgi:hypothetical protein